MISKYTIGSRIHQALERICRSPVHVISLRADIKFTESIIRLKEYILDPLLKDGFVTVNADVYTITPMGEMKFEQMGPFKKPLSRKSQINKFEGVYDGKELRRYEGRPGAMNHEQYPSLMGEVLVYRRSR
jgi:hypothetical protein